MNQLKFFNLYVTNTNPKPVKKENVKIPVKPNDSNIEPNPVLTLKALEICQKLSNLFTSISKNILLNIDGTSPFKKEKSNVRAVIKSFVFTKFITGVVMYI